jgi:hypothetical protein
MMKVRLAPLVCGVTMLLMSAAPILANAQANIGSPADATCISFCAMMAAQKPPAICPQPPALQACQTTAPGGGTVAGICMPDGCKATSASGLKGGNSLDQGLSQLGQILGKLLSSLGGGGGGGGGSPSPTPSTGTTCTSYTPTSDPTQIGGNPCLYYVPSSASQLTTTGTTGTNSSAQDLLNSLTGSTGAPVGTPTGSSTTATGDTLTATPLSGPAPLLVTFATTPSATDVGPFTINFGDGSSPQAISRAACTSSVPASCSYQASNTYTSAGTYTATLLDANGGTLASATISVVNAGGSTAPATGSGLTQVFQSVGGLLAGSSTPQAPGQTSPNFPGVFGNLLLDQNGATIFAATVNSANNSETSGFYGSNTVGGQSQGLAGQLCQGRPWASNVLADIIPPSFFDSLCQWGGYQVGQPPVATQPQVTLSQQTQTQVATQPQSAPAKPKTSTPAATTTPAVPAQVQIWAVPSSVPLGARTSVFWNTQGVTQCTESSPDGSFNEASLSGAAATVPITSATTFTISCLDPNGNPVTDYVTVAISN